MAWLRDVPEILTLLTRLFAARLRRLARMLPFGRLRWHSSDFFGTYELAQMRFGGSTTFPDGSSLEQDPRREDPLVYYVPTTGWDAAVGFSATEVTVSGAKREITLEVSPTSHSRLRDLTDADLHLIVSRVTAGVTVRGSRIVAVTWPEFVTDRLKRS